MSQHFFRSRTSGAVCRHCDHDLMVRTGHDRRQSDGKVYCSNPSCAHHRAPYVTKQAISQGRS